MSFTNPNPFPLGDDPTDEQRIRSEEFDKIVPQGGRWTMGQFLVAKKNADDRLSGKALETKIFDQATKEEVAKRKKAEASGSLARPAQGRGSTGGRRGFASTIRTSPFGILSQPQTGGKRLFGQ